MNMTIIDISIIILICIIGILCYRIEKLQRKINKLSDLFLKVINHNEQFEKQVGEDFANVLNITNLQKDAIIHTSETLIKIIEQSEIKSEGENNDG